MPALLDHIFSSLDIESLGQKKIMEYLCYLEEITPQVHTVEELIKLSKYRVALTKQLIYVGRAASNDLQSELAEGRRSINSKKAKYHLV